jgi:cytochrome P450
MHLAHGVPHRLGAPRARPGGRIALGSLVARFPLRLAVPAELARTPAVVMNGLAALPVRLR